MDINLKQLRSRVANDIACGYKAINMKLGEVLAILERLETADVDGERYRALRDTGTICASVVGTGISLPISNDYVPTEAQKAALDASVDRLIAASKKED